MNFDICETISIVKTTYIFIILKSFLVPICNVSADLLTVSIDKFIFSEIEMNGIIQFVP